MTRAALAAGLVLAGSGAALALDDSYRGPDRVTRAGQILIHPYRAPNRCPAGRQPIVIGGVICCGVPNTDAYYVDRPGGHRRSYSGGASMPATTPEGVKGVVYE